MRKEGLIMTNKNEKALEKEGNKCNNIIIQQKAIKESFVLYSEQRELIDILSDEEAGKLFKNIFKYVNGEIPQLNGAVQMAFISIRQQLDRNAAKYEAKKEKLRQNGLKGGRPKKNSTQNKSNGFSENQMVNLESKKSLYVNDNVNVNDNNIIDISETKTFKNPTLDEIRNYCTERKNNVNAEQFYDFYASKGWMIGKNKMKDWKAAIRTWERNTKNDNAEKSEMEESIDYAHMPYKPF